jgi:hypothetical protein
MVALPIVSNRLLRRRRRPEAGRTLGVTNGTASAFRARNSSGERQPPCPQSRCGRPARRRAAVATAAQLFGFGPPEEHHDGLAGELHEVESLPALFADLVERADYG